MTPEELLKNCDPVDYAKTAVLAHEVGLQLLARLEWMTIQPKTIVDIGCGVGDLVKSLAFKDAQIVAMDPNFAMVSYAKQQSETNSISWLCADPVRLPFANNSVDLITANLFLPWCSAMPAWFAECRRILRPDGLFIFTCLGPDTLMELRHIEFSHPHLFDMHNVGDELIHAGLKEPVLDVEYFTMVYKDPQKLFYELKATGMFAGAEVPLSVQDEGFPLTFEVIHGHAWKGADSFTHEADEAGVVKIPLSHLLRR